MTARFWMWSGTSAVAETRVHEQQPLPVFHTSAPSLVYVSAFVA